MDPQPLVAQTWDKLSEIVYFFWFFLAAMSVFGGSLLLAHAIIPSLVATGHIGVRVGRLRPLFYLASLLALGLAIFLLVKALTGLAIVREIYQRYWI